MILPNMRLNTIRSERDNFKTVGNLKKNKYREIEREEKKLKWAGIKTGVENIEN